MNCELVQEQILLGSNRTPEIESHIESCRDCQAFLKTEKHLANLPRPTAMCPDSLSFEKVKYQSDHTIPFKPLIGMAAAALFLLCIQFSIYRPESISPDTVLISATLIDQTIELEIDSIDGSLTDLEPFLYETSNQFDLDLESLTTDFETLTLTLEVS